MTLRALDVLKTADVIAAEDTRVTARLLEHYSITAKKMIALHEHNESRAVQTIIAYLGSGSSVALVSDAGTPAFSDPGARLVAAVRTAGYRVTPVPGPNAAAAALSASGFTDRHFLFYGFLPAKSGERRKVLQTLSRQRYLLVLYEAPHRVAETIADIEAAFGGARQILIARELTKLFETVHACTLGEASAWLAADTNRVRGEFVLVIEGAPEDADATFNAARATLEVLLEELPVRQAAALASKLTGASKNELYALALKLKDRQS